MLRRRDYCQPPDLPFPEKMIIFSGKGKSGGWNEGSREFKFSRERVQKKFELIISLCSHIYCTTANCKETAELQ